MGETQGDKNKIHGLHQSLDNYHWHLIQGCHYYEISEIQLFFSENTLFSSFLSMKYIQFSSFHHRKPTKFQPTTRGHDLEILICKGGPLQIQIFQPPHKKNENL